MVYVTTQQGSINLAASVNVILYDRLAKRIRAGAERAE
ncbi:RNA methyltransferase [Aeromonas sp. 1HA1]|nr:RNA methyltransferase [Aeromonas sp. 1HA1]